MITFIFSSNNAWNRVYLHDLEEWGYDDEEVFQKDVIDYFGQEIVSLKKEIPGYYDVVFEDGHTLYSISGLYIDKREV